MYSTTRIIVIQFYICHENKITSRRGRDLQKTKLLLSSSLNNNLLH